MPERKVTKVRGRVKDKGETSGLVALSNAGPLKPIVIPSFIPHLPPLRPRPTAGGPAFPLFLLSSPCRGCPILAEKWPLFFSFDARVGIDTAYPHPSKSARQVSGHEFTRAENARTNSSLAPQAVAQRSGATKDFLPLPNIPFKTFPQLRDLLRRHHPLRKRMKNGAALVNHKRMIVFIKTREI
jgi:hypothetical protein